MPSIKVKAIRLFSLNLSIFLHNIHFIVLSNNLFILSLSEITPWWGNGKRASLECWRPWVCFWFMVLNATIFQFVVAVSFIGEETPEDPGKHPICASHLQTVSHSVIHLEPTTSVVIGTDWIGSCKFNYHAITITTASLDRGFEHLSG